jgi:putative hydrolase of the HAD superfamily
LPTKPDPEAFSRACQRLDISPNHCLYVGDSLDLDALASAAAGLRRVWLDRTCNGADPGSEIGVIQSLLDLPGLIDGLI